jgi:uncharacterized protein (UPF0332 family)/predicted nucleotidyltransferase
MAEKKPKIVKQKTEIKTPNLKSQRDIAMDFAVKAHQKFDRMIKASVFFGSQARNMGSATSDIDIIFIIDDASVKWDIELIAWYREELGKLINSQEHGSELHINTVKLSTWWQDLLQGDPVVVNILRYGESLIDSGGFFNPLKALLQEGKIRSTPEAVYNSLQRAPMHLARSRAAEMGAIEGVYWCIVDSAQAALMMAGKTPPSPEKIPEMLVETFVDAGMLKISYAKQVKEIYMFHKGIAHGQIAHISGSDVEKWQRVAEDFLSEMTRIINQLIENKR